MEIPVSARHPLAESKRRAQQPKKRRSTWSSHRRVFVPPGDRLYSAESLTHLPSSENVVRELDDLVCGA